VKLLKGAFILGVFFISLTYLCMEGRAQTKGSAPVITFAWAQERIRQGDDWRIYIAANDPDGDMYRIYCRIDQPGGQVYRPDISNIKKGMEGQLTGYLVLRTFSPQDFFGLYLTLNLTIVDRAGHESQSYSFPLAIDGERTKFPPPDLIPAGLEKSLNQRIGYIGIDLMRRDRMGGGGD
jgi:hypothetical protein